jgi:hypothetical protein
MENAPVEKRKRDWVNAWTIAVLPAFFFAVGYVLLLIQKNPLWVGMMILAQISSPLFWLLAVIYYFQSPSKPVQKYQNTQIQINTIATLIEVVIFLNFVFAVVSNGGITGPG